MSAEPSDHLSVPPKRARSSSRPFLLRTAALLLTASVAHTISPCDEAANVHALSYAFLDNCLSGVYSSGSSNSSMPGSLLRRCSPVRSLLLPADEELTYDPTCACHELVMAVRMAVDLKFFHNFLFPSRRKIKRKEKKKGTSALPSRAIAPCRSTESA